MAKISTSLKIDRSTTQSESFHDQDIRPRANENKRIYRCAYNQMQNQSKSESMNQFCPFSDGIVIVTYPVPKYGIYTTSWRHYVARSSLLH